jgi:hypothetical protein
MDVVPRFCTDTSSWFTAKAGVATTASTSTQRKTVLESFDMNALPWQEVAAQTYTAGSLAHKPALGFRGAAAPLEAPGRSLRQSVATAWTS